MTSLNKLRELPAFSFRTGIPEGFSGVCTIPNTNAMFWIKNGKIHRDNDLPAIITFDRLGQTLNYKWLQYNVLHRVGAPAILYERTLKNTNQYWLNGNQYDSNKFWNIPANAKHKLDVLLK